MPPFEHCLRFALVSNMTQSKHRGKGRSVYVERVLCVPHGLLRQALNVCRELVLVLHEWLVNIPVIPFLDPGFQVRVPRRIPVKIKAYNWVSVDVKDRAQSRWGNALTIQLQPPPNVGFAKLVGSIRLTIRVQFCEQHGYRVTNPLWCAHRLPCLRERRKSFVSRHVSRLRM